MAYLIIALWGGSAVAGWRGSWLWLLVPFAVMCFYLLNMMNNMRAMRDRNGLPHPGFGSPLSMAGPNTILLVTNTAQNAAFFGAGMLAHWLFR